MYKIMIFDIDGTLLDTINDIQTYVNQALEITGYPFRYDRKGTSTLIGNGVRMLMKRAIQNDDPRKLEEFANVFLPLYQKGENELSIPFPGMKEVLKKLKSRGVRLYAMSNKPDELANRLMKREYPTLFEEIIGKKEKYPPKPDPYWTLKIIETAKIKPEEALYVGDSLPDLLTAQNAKIDACICRWGYGNYADKKLEEAKYQIVEANSLLKISLLG